MGGKSPVATNNQIVQMQEQQAAQASQADTQLKARLKYGANEIQQMFEGHPKGASLLDLSSLSNMATPTRAADPNAALENAWYASQGMSAPDLGAPGSGTLPNGYTWRGLPNTGGAPSYGIFDPQGNMVTNATSLADLSKSKIYIGGDASQTEGGFGSDFYDKYKKSITDYYMPQEDQQYQDARSKLTYALARAGGLGSSTENQYVADLANQDKLAQANINQQAETQTGQLRTQIQQNEQSALNQLYATEDPTIAANTAENMVANADLTKPVYSSLGSLFNVAAIGVGNALSGFTNPYAYINPAAGGMGSMSTSGSAGTSGGSSSSGVPQSA